MLKFRIKVVAWVPFRCVGFSACCGDFVAGTQELGCFQLLTKFGDEQSQFFHSDFRV